MNSSWIQYRSYVTQYKNRISIIEDSSIGWFSIHKKQYPCSANLLHITEDLLIRQIIHKDHHQLIRSKISQCIIKQNQTMITLNLQSNSIHHYSQSSHCNMICFWWDKSLISVSRYCWSSKSERISWLCVFRSSSSLSLNSTHISTPKQGNSIELSE